MHADLGPITIAYETHGDPADPVVLLVHGLGAQLVAWELEFVQRFVDAGFHVVRFDNRDIGLSTKVTFPDGLDPLAEILRHFGGESVEAPYLLTDMADDAIGLLDHLGIERAHVVGVSMGGMISQQIAINAPRRVASLTSIMSTTGDPDVGQANPEVLGLLMTPPPPGRDNAIEASVGVSAAIASPGLFDEARARRLAAQAYDRSFYPEGTPQQGLAIVASGSRSAALRTVDVPTLVIHGDADPLVHISGGERTAEVMPNAELMVVGGMAHDIPVLFWDQVIDAITAHATKADLNAIGLRDDAPSGP